MATKTTVGGEYSPLAAWRLKGFGGLRIVFGVVWGIDGWFKWQPDFVNSFSTYLTGAQDGQPWLVHHWIGFWINTVGIDPTFFAYATAVGETAIAVALIAGAFTNLTAIVGTLLSVVIWSTAEGFGWPVHSGE
jgi:nitrite reductase (NO-forming)